MDWAQSLDNLAGHVTDIALAKIAAPSKPVMLDKTGGVAPEGQPTHTDAMHKFMGLSPVVLIAGALALSVVGYFALRK